MLTTGQICVRLGALPWHLNRALSRGLLTEPQRIGCYRIWHESDLPRIRAALVSLGYLQPEEVAADAK